MSKLRNLIGVLVFTALVMNYSPASAQTTTSSIQSLIQALQQQIETLKAQLETLKQAQLQVNQTVQSAGETLKLIRQLRVGMSGDDVKALQAILAMDSNVYPEGLITGFFGPLTAKAVKKYQQKAGLEQTGGVGPKTFKKINDDLDENLLTTEDNDRDSEENDNEDSDNDNGKRLCVIVPPGHLIAPGWLKKHDDVKSVVPECQEIPHGIAKKLGITTSTPPIADTTAPTISQISLVNITSSTANVNWVTNENANSVVWYATSTPVVLTSPTASVSTSTLSLNHSISLQGLTASTTYYYVVSSKDSSGNIATSSQSSLSTLSQ